MNFCANENGEIVGWNYALIFNQFGCISKSNFTSNRLVTAYFYVSIENYIYKIFFEIFNLPNNANFIVQTDLVFK